MILVNLCAVVKLAGLYLFRYLNPYRTWHLFINRIKRAAPVDSVIPREKSWESPYFFRMEKNLSDPCGTFPSFRPIKPQHSAESGGVIKAKPFGRFATLTPPPFFRLFMFVADGRECLRRGFRAGIHGKSRKAERQFTQRRNTPQISCPELPLADPRQEAA